MKSSMTIDKYFCFLDKNYKDTIAIQDTTQGASRDLFRWDRRFTEPRGTDRNKLNVPMEVVIQAFNTLDVEGLSFGKKDTPVRSRVVATSAVDDNSILMKLMIQQAKINSERFNSMQDRINQLSEENILLMQVVSNGMANDVVKVDKANVEFDTPIIKKEEPIINEVEEEVIFVPTESDEELPPRNKKSVSDTVAAASPDEEFISPRRRKKPPTTYHILNE